MKRFLTIILLFATCLSMMAIQIGNTSLDPRNMATYDSKSGLGIKSGSITYDPGSNALYLNGVTLYNSLIIDRPTAIVVNGINVIKTELATPLEFNHANSVILGAGKEVEDRLDITITGEVEDYLLTGVMISGCDLIVRNCDLHVSSRYGVSIQGDKPINKGGYSTIAFENSDAVLYSGANPVVKNLESVAMRGCSVINPTNCEFDAETYTFQSNGEEVYGDLTINYKRYPVYVAGTQVTSRNASDVLGDGTIAFQDNLEEQGSASLLLRNARINSDSPCIFVTSDWTSPMHITSSGQCELFSQTDNVVLLGGSGSFVFDALDASWIFLKSFAQTGANYDNTIHVASTVKSVEFRGDESNLLNMTIGSYNGSALKFVGTDTKLSFDDVSVWFVTTTTSPVISGAFSTQPQFTDCYLHGTSGEYFNTSMAALTDESGNYTSDIKILPGYGIQVGGVDITKRNLDASTEGKVLYNPETNVLYISEDLTFENSDVTPLYIANKNTNVFVINDAVCDFSTTDGIPVLLNNADNVRFVGSGTMKLQSPLDSYYVGIMGFNTNLSVQGLKLDVTTGHGQSISLRGGGLTVDGAFVKASKSSTKGKAVFDVNSLSLVNSRFENPNYVFDTYVKDLSTGEFVDDYVSIITDLVEVYDLVIGGVQVTSENAMNIQGEGIEGYVSYHPETNTLTLQDATINNNNTSVFGAIYVNNMPLNINLIGKNEIYANSDDYCCGIVSVSDANNNGLTISCMDRGSLDINLQGPSTYGINADNDLSIVNCDVNIKADYAGLSTNGEDGVNCLTITNSEVTLLVDHYPLLSSYGIMMTNVFALVPEDATFTTIQYRDESSKYVIADAGGSPARGLVIIDNKLTQDHVKTAIDAYLNRTIGVSMYGIVNMIDHIVTKK